MWCATAMNIRRSGTRRRDAVRDLVLGLGLTIVLLNGSEVAAAEVAHPAGQEHCCPGGAIIAVSDNLDWLLYKPNTDYLLQPRRQPGYREPGDPPFVPEPLPDAPSEKGRRASPEPEVAPAPATGWRKGMLACEVVRQRIAAAGYATVRAVDCQGDYYGYQAEREGTRYRLIARARDGRIVAKIPNGSR